MNNDTISAKSTLNSQLLALKERASVIRERIARKDDLLSSCERELREAKTRFDLANKRKTEMEESLISAPIQLSDIDSKIVVLRKQLAVLDAEELKVKAADLAKQIQKLQKMGFKVTLPTGEQV